MAVVRRAEKLREIFQAADLDDDGKLAREEFKRVLCRLTPGMTDAEFDVLFQKFDANHDGYINQQEFTDWLLSATGEASDECKSSPSPKSSPKARPKASPKATGKSIATQTDTLRGLFLSKEDTEKYGFTPGSTAKLQIVQDSPIVIAKIPSAHAPTPAPATTQTLAPILAPTATPDPSSRSYSNSSSSNSRYHSNSSSRAPPPAPAPAPTPASIPASASANAVPRKKPCISQQVDHQQGREKFNVLPEEFTMVESTKREKLQDQRNVNELGGVVHEFKDLSAKIDKFQDILGPRKMSSQSRGSKTSAKVVPEEFTSLQPKNFGERGGTSPAKESDVSAKANKYSAGFVGRFQNDEESQSRGSRIRHVLLGSQRESSKSSFAESLWQQEIPRNSLLPKLYTKSGQWKCCLFLGTLCCISGAALLAESDAVKSVSFVYDATNSHVDFSLDSDWSEAVYLYYELRGFYGNYRAFVENRDNFLVGSPLMQYKCEGAMTYTDAKSIRPSSRTLLSMLEAPANPGQELSPCGLVAVSMFADVYHLESISSNASIEMDFSNVAWSSDMKMFNKKIEGDPPTLTIDGKRSWLTSNLWKERFATWYRTSAGSTVRHLWAKIPQGLSKGRYRLNFTSNDPIWTEQWNVEKAVVISTVSAIGGANNFIGSIAIAWGVVLLVSGMAWFVAPKPKLASEQ